MQLWSSVLLTTLCSSTGLRLGSYLQAVAFFVLVLVAPDEGGAEALWLSFSVSYAFVLTNYVQLYLGSITLHHTIVVITLSTLPYIARLAGMNSLTSYRGLGARGMIVLQTGESPTDLGVEARSDPSSAGLLVKAILTAILWGFCLYAWFEGQLPESTQLMFRQPHCLDSTAIVAFFVPLRSEDAEHYSRSRAILILHVRANARLTSRRLRLIIFTSLDDFLGCPSDPRLLLDVQGADCPSSPRRSLSPQAKARQGRREVLLYARAEGGSSKAAGKDGRGSSGLHAEQQRRGEFAVRRRGGSR
jgi:hypothetical protein